MMMSRLLATAMLLAAMPPVAAQAPGAPDMVTVHGDRPAPKFDRRLFGQFAEHLGHGIYDGIWAGRTAASPASR